MLSKEFQYYIENQKKLSKKYLGKYLIIKDCKVVEAFDKEIDAYREGREKYGLGNFLLQQCFPDRESITSTYQSRVIINE